jgi:hypothetical protein
MSHLPSNTSFECLLVEPCKQRKRPSRPKRCRSSRLARFLKKLPVSVRVLHGDSIAHGKLTSEPDRNMSIFSSARIFSSPSGTDSVFAPWMTFSIPNGPFSSFPASNELFCVVRVESKRPDVVLLFLDETVKIVVDLHHIQNTVPSMMWRLPSDDELFVLVPHRTRQLVIRRQLGDVAPAVFTPNPPFGRGKQKCEGTEVIAQRKVRTQRARHPPERLGRDAGESLRT